MLFFVVIVGFCLVARKSTASEPDANVLRHHTPHQVFNVVKGRRSWWKARDRACADEEADIGDVNARYRRSLFRVSDATLCSTVVEDADVSISPPAKAYFADLHVEASPGRLADAASHPLRGDTMFP